MSNMIWRPPIIFGGRQSVWCTTFFYANNFYQKHWVTERLYFVTGRSLKIKFYTAGRLERPIGTRVETRSDHSENEIRFIFRIKPLYVRPTYSRRCSMTHEHHNHVWSEKRYRKTIPYRR